MSSYLPIIVITFVGFVTLAAILLVPVYRFLKREEEVSAQWTDRELARRHRSADPSPNGHTPSEEREPPR